MARFVPRSLRLTTTNVRRITVACKAGVQEHSNYHRIRHFLADYEVDYATLSTLLIRLVLQRPPSPRGRLTCWFWNEPNGPSGRRSSTCS